MKGVTSIYQVGGFKVMAEPFEKLLIYHTLQDLQEYIVKPLVKI